MTNENPLQQAGNASNSMEKTVDNAINSGIDQAATHIPGGQKFEQTAKDKADQAANNAITNETSKGAGGMMNDAKGMLGK